MNMQIKIQDYYKESFGIDIELITDSDRGDNLLPIGCCAVYRNDMIHNGLLCCAAIRTPEGTDGSDESLMKIINSTLNKNEYTEVRFITQIEAKKDYRELTPAEIEKDSKQAACEDSSTEPFLDDTCISWLVNSICRAIEAIDEYLATKGMPLT